MQPRHTTRNIRARLQRWWDQRNAHSMAETPMLIVGVGLPVSGLLGLFTHSATNFFVVEGFFVTGGLTLLVSRWQVRSLTQHQERATFNGLKQSIEQRLEVPYYPVFLERLERTGKVARPPIEAPIALPYLDASIDLAAKAPRLESLYRTLLEVRRRLDHLNVLRQLNPQIAISAWAMHGHTLAAGPQRDHPDPDAAWAIYRSTQIILERGVAEGEAQLRWEYWLRRTHRLLSRVLAGDRAQGMALPPPDPHGESSDPFLPLRHLLVQPPSPAPEALRIIQATAQRVLKEWQDSRVTEAVSGNYGN